MKTWIVLNAFILLSGISIYSCKNELFVPEPPNPVTITCVQKESISDFVTPINVYFPGDTSNGLVKAIKTNKTWKAKTFAGYYHDKKFIGLTFSTKSCEILPFCNSESMFLGWVPIKKGCFKLIYSDQPVFDTAQVRVSYKTYDGDIEEDVYKIEPDTLGNNLEITRIDTTQKIVEGKFAGSFRLITKGGKINPENPDKLRFFNGEFRAKIQ